MFLKKIFILFIFIFQSSFLFSAPAANWVVLTYMQADDSVLEDYIIYDLQEMADVGSNDNLKILAQVDVSSDGPLDEPATGTRRYYVTPGGLTYSDFDFEMGNDVVQELVDAMAWVVNDYPADHYMLIIYGHGSGVEDPNSSRGLLFDETQDSYMTNPQLAEALGKIKDEVLGGKKLDLLAIAGCTSSYIELAYQVADYVDFYVASQEEMLVLGLENKGFLSRLATGSHTTKEAAGYIVQAYEDYYGSLIDYNTLTATDLSLINALYSEVESLAYWLKEIKRIDGTRANELINESRNNCIQFWNSKEIDLHSFLYELFRCWGRGSYSYRFGRPEAHGRHSRPQVPTSVSRIPLDYCRAAANLKKTAGRGMRLFNSLVTAKTIGSDYTGSGGLSIYYPNPKEGDTIHNSYSTLKFVTNGGQWLEFLEGEVG
jgi:hypothetical protein